MCGRYSLTSPPELLVALFGLRSRPDLLPRYNIAPTQPAAIVRSAGGDTRELVSVRWGLIPHWVTDPASVASTAPMINARSETAARKPAFREPWRRRRCLVPASGFFEWKAVGSIKQPYYVHRPDDTPLAFAGLWERWEPPGAAGGDGGAPIESFTILTTTPTEQLRTLHDRMPVILEPDRWSRWLDPAVTDPEPGILPDGSATTVGLEIHPVSRRVNRTDQDDAGCIVRIELEPPPPPEPTLFG